LLFGHGWWNRKIVGFSCSHLFLHVSDGVKSLTETFLLINRKYGKVKVVRSIVAVKKNLTKHPDPEVNINTFNNLKQYNEETARLEKKEEGRSFKRLKLLQKRISLT
jgi:hypothetical protein